MGKKRRRMTKFLLIGAVVSFLGFSVNPFVEAATFRIETAGTQHCGDLNWTNFNAKKNLDVWVRVDGPNDLAVSPNPDFAPPVFLGLGKTYRISEKKSALSFLILDPDRLPGDADGDVSFAAFNGTATNDEFGAVHKLEGEYIDHNLAVPGCFSAGSVKSVE
jgi:hypothetical protein